MSAPTSLTIQLSGSQGKTGRYEQALESLGARPRAGYCPAPDLSCDGLILCGGGDLESSLFGQENQGSNPPDVARDQAELELFRAFYQANKPILGICRGMQVINVALGGDLIQDLPSHIRIFHSAENQEPVHPVRSLEGSMLHQLYGPRFPVNSIHHQAVDRLGTGLRAIAWSESGVVEAMDCPGRPILAVQFHPERMAFAYRRPDTIDGAPILSHFLTLCRQAHAL